MQCRDSSEGAQIRFYSEKYFFSADNRKKKTQIFFFLVAETVCESILADTCCPQVVYSDGADLWVCCCVQQAAGSRAESVSAGCVSSLQPSHFTLNASWRAEMSGNNPSNRFPISHLASWIQNKTLFGIYSDFIVVYWILLFYCGKGKAEFT